MMAWMEVVVILFSTKKNNADTSNIIMYMFRFENATTKDGTVIWTNKRHGSASTCRPVMLLLGKE